MKDPSAAVSEAVYQKLRSNAGVKALLSDPARVFDKVPADPTYPYARIGDDQAVGDSNGCADAWEMYVNVHIFSRHGEYPRIEAKEISNAVTLALGNNDDLIAPAGFSISEVELIQTRTFMEDDGVTAHALVTLQYQIDDAA